MITIIKNGEVYSPEYLGTKDVLVLAGKISLIDENISVPTNLGEVTVIDASEKLVVPGLVDSHVHIIGGGGEGGFKTRTPEINLSQITKSGVTTVVGCLGTDGITRQVTSLLAKARGLEEEGISTYIYTGSYKVPTTTITESIMEDIMLIDKVIGTGEIALSDHRSSQPSVEDIAKLASETRVGGILSSKAGIINIHMGDGGRELSYLEEITRDTEIPKTQFLPTHINRNGSLMDAGIEYAKSGGYIDLTTSADPNFLEPGEYTASAGLKYALDSGVHIESITFSSDGQGSMPMFNDKRECIGLGIGEVYSLFTELRDSVLVEGVSIDTALKVVTSNPARILKLANKGMIETGKDADILIIDKANFEVDTLIANGKVMVKDKDVIVKGTFEK